MAGFDVVLFATLLMALVVESAPRLAEAVGGPPIVGWFLGGGAMFAAMAGGGVWLLRREVSRWTLRDVLREIRLGRPTGSHVLAGLRGLAIAGVVSGGVLVTLWLLTGREDGSIPGLAPPTLTLPEDPPAWLPLAWLPLFLLNVGCEEFLWRGLLLPRQERYHGRHAWLWNGLGVTVFHVPLGVPLTLVVAPFLFAMARVCQRQESLWPPLVLHATLNATAFACAMAGVW